MFSELLWEWQLGLENKREEDHNVNSADVLLSWAFHILACNASCNAQWLSVHSALFPAIVADWGVGEAERSFFLLSSRGKSIERHLLSVSFFYVVVPLQTQVNLFLPLHCCIVNL